MEPLYPTLTLLAGLALAGLFTWRAMGRRLQRELNARDERFAAERAHLEQRLAEREVSVSELRRELAALQEAGTALAVSKARFVGVAQRLPELDRRLREREAAIERLRERLNAEAAARAQAEEHARRADHLEQELAARDAEVAEARDRAANLEARLAAHQEAEAERLRQFQEARAQMTEQFENLARRILEDNSRRFAEQNRSGIGELLNPVREQLDGFRRQVEAIHLRDVRDRTSLAEQLNALRDLNRQMSQEAVALTRALKGDQKAQGDWGELILERVLEQSGLRKGEEYQTQGGFRDRDGRLLRPDVIVRLPEGRDVVVDSKVSLAAYTRYAAAEEGGERQQALREHVRAVRAHIETLAAKDYSALHGLRSLDFVLMFMPIEGAFSAAFQADQALYSDAFERRVVVVTPTTLLATLRTIANLWRYEHQNANAGRIAERAGAVYDKLRGLVEEMERLGTQIAGLHASYDAAMNRLCRGRGNLVRQAERFRELGVRVKRELPKGAVESADRAAEEETELP